jgi:hypothetical protein
LKIIQDDDDEISEGVYAWLQESVGSRHQGERVLKKATHMQEAVSVGAKSAELKRDGDRTKSVGAKSAELKRGGDCTKSLFVGDRCDNPADLVAARILTDTTTYRGSTRVTGRDTAGLVQLGL